MLHISIHASVREATLLSFATASPGIFQSTLPVREATEVDHVPALMAAISIHASREGSDMEDGTCVDADGISIHASREGSDPIATAFITSSADFNPRFP